jgi:hypothetical protein
MPKSLSGPNSSQGSPVPTVSPRPAVPPVESTPVHYETQNTRRTHGAARPARGVKRVAHFDQRRDFAPGRFQEPGDKVAPMWRRRTAPVGLWPATDLAKASSVKRQRVPGVVAERSEARRRENAAGERSGAKDLCRNGPPSPPSGLSTEKKPCGAAPTRQALGQWQMGMTGSTRREGRRLSWKTVWSAGWLRVSVAGSPPVLGFGSHSGKLLLVI